MTTSTVIGIDPGLTGGIAILKPDEAPRLWSMPTEATGKKRELDLLTISNLLANECKDDRTLPLAVIEHVHSMPSQGVTSSFRFGYSYGAVCGIVCALGFKLERVTPQRWKKEMMHGMPKGKHASIIRARELFPNVHALDHGRADALLIAEHARRMM